jgi:hypothetical protein
VTAAAPDLSRRLACAQCGATFDCSLNGDCWCAAEPVLLPVPPADASAAAQDCLCPACLRSIGHGLDTIRS